MLTRLRQFAIRQYGVSDAALIMALAFASSAVLGIIRQVLIGATFGDGATVAAYYAAARLPETLVTLVAGGALTAALVPVLVRESDVMQQRIINALTSVVAVLVIGASIIGIIGAGWLVRELVLPGSPTTTQDLTISLTRLLFAQPLLLALASLLSATLSAHTRFGMIAVAYVSHNVMIILGVLAARAFPALSVYGPTLGLVAAAALKLVFVWWGLRLNGMQVYWYWEPRLPQLRTIAYLAVPTALSATVNYAGNLVDTSYASRVGVTAVAALYSGWLLADMPTRLIGSAIGQAVFPHLAVAAAQQDPILLRRLFMRTTGIALLLCIPVVLLVWYGGRAGIALILERGAFDAAAGDRTYAVLQWYVIGLPAYVTTELLSRLLNALHDTRTPLLTNIGQLVCKAFVLTVVGVSGGMVLVPIAHSTTCIVETMVLSLVVWRRFVALQRHATT
jgi:putative peptidoglycan lipid II flippase